MLVKKTTKSFNPVVVTITLETETELSAFKNLMGSNATVSNNVSGISDDERSTLNSMMINTYRCLDNR